MLQWFQRLMPRQEMFFPLFERHAAVVVTGAETLRKMFEGGKALKSHCQEVLTLESKADGIAREVFIGVRTTFITPFDRADIQSLIASMDDAIDQMQQTAKAIILFELTTFEPEMGAMADAIVDCAKLVKRAVSLLSSVISNAATLSEICFQITHIEEDADALHDRGLKQLYEKAKVGDPMEFIRRSAIYDHLEECIDRFEDISNEIQGIVTEQV